MARIALIPGDGIGPEVLAEAEKVLGRISEIEDLPLEFDRWPHGADRYLETGSGMEEEEIRRLGAEYDGILLGALGDPRVPGNEHARQILLGLRFQLDLYINLRPVRLLDRRLTPLRDIREEDLDLVIFRENTEGVYVGMGGVFRKGTPQEMAIQEDVNTRFGIERIVRAAFEHARDHDVDRVTLSDKANAMEHAGGLWRRVFQEVGEEFPDIEREALYVDMLAMDLVRRPSRYRVIVTGNLFGDILSDLAAQLAGGLGLAASANLHPGKAALFEPVHGSAPDIAGSGNANPLAAILTSALLLRHLGRRAAADRVEAAVRGAIGANETTADLGGALTTAETGDAVVRRLDSAA